MVCYPPQEGWEDTDNRSKNLPRMFPFRSAIKRGLVRLFDALFFLFVYISFLSLCLFFPTPSPPQHKKVQILFAMQDGGARKGASLLTRYFLNGSFFSFSFFFGDTLRDIPIFCLYANTNRAPGSA